MSTATPRPAKARGSTLIESMVALTILLVGMLGLMQLQVYGVTSNAGARAQTRAYQLARELASSLEQLGPDDLLLTPHFDGETAPADFGRLLLPAGTIASGGFLQWDDTAHGPLLRGVTLDSALGGQDPIDPALPLFQRRWQVWQVSTAAAASGVKTIAVSVVYREKNIPFPREVVLLTQVSNKGLSAAFAAAYR
jgi:type IV pilus assembly protein PilV